MNESKQTPTQGNSSAEVERRIQENSDILYGPTDPDITDGWDPTPRPLGIPDLPYKRQTQDAHEIPAGHTAVTSLDKQLPKQ